MKRKVLSILIAFLAVVSLVGCQNNKKASVNKTHGVGSVRTNNTDSKSNDDSDSDTTNENSNGSLWNSDKQEKLDEFFDDWADTMDQNYEKYDGSGQIKTAAGEEFPKEFDRMAVNGQKVSMSYEPSGKGDSDYNVVAIYNYDKNEGASHITYFFAFHNDQPIVLVDETTNGDLVQAKETANKDLINGFNAIVAGKNATMTDSGETDSDSDEDTNDSNDDSEDPELIGVFIGLLKDGDWFKDNLKSGHMYFGEDWSEKGEMKGYDYITANGDPTSYFWFKQDGDDVTVKFVDPGKNQSVAEAPVKTEHYTVARLKSDYYVNSGQKQEVNGYVDKMKSIDDAD